MRPHSAHHTVKETLPEGAFPAFAKQLALDPFPSVLSRPLSGRDAVKKAGTLVALQLVAGGGLGLAIAAAGEVFIIPLGWVLQLLGVEGGEGWAYGIYLTLIVPVVIISGLLNFSDSLWPRRWAERLKARARRMKYPDSGKGLLAAQRELRQARAQRKAAGLLARLTHRWPLQAAVTVKWSVPERTWRMTFPEATTLTIKLTPEGKLFIEPKDARRIVVDDPSDLEDPKLVALMSALPAAPNAGYAVAGFWGVMGSWLALWGVLLFASVQWCLASFPAVWAMCLAYGALGTVGALVYGLVDWPSKLIPLSRRPCRSMAERAAGALEA